MIFRNKRIIALTCAVFVMVTSFTGCGSQIDSKGDFVEIQDEEVAMSATPDSSSANNSSKESDSSESATTETIKNLKSGNGAEIDYSHIEDGYVKTRFTEKITQRLKVQVKGPTTTYTYNLDSDNKWDTYPLSDGNGAYTVSVFKNVSGTKYTSVTSVSFDVNLKDEFAPFIRPNQYVNYGIAKKTKAKAKYLCKNKKTTLKKVAAVYDWVVDNLTYDKQKAKTVQSGYLPVLDSVFKAKKGICFDYAALMTGMLRSQGVPCKLIIGYAGTAYHAWISVYVEGEGWLDNAIYFDGVTWQRMDPTFASSGKASPSIMKYIGNGKNYTTKYIY